MSDIKSGSKGAEAATAGGRATRGRATTYRGRYVSQPGSSNRKGRFSRNGGRSASLAGHRAEAANEPDPRSFHYYVLYKPYGVPCRFVEGSHGALSLASYMQVHKVFPIGQLDTESEGLLLFTDNPRFRYGLMCSSCEERRLYLAQVENVPEEETIAKLRRGVTLKDGSCSSVEMTLIDDPQLSERPVPIRERQSVPTVWTEIITTEGWSHHVRRLTAQVGHPTLRLLQWALGPVTLRGLEKGQCREFSFEERRWAEAVAAEAPEPNKRFDRLRRMARKAKKMREKLEDRQVEMSEEPKTVASGRSSRSEKGLRPARIKKHHSVASEQSPRQQERHNHPTGSQVKAMVRKQKKRLKD